ncbi:MAG: aspartate/glutamate racemase family protein [Roseovarius sp.]|nr:aspartate/glutamate racemase family protein [Roseovarius sp.]
MNYELDEGAGAGLRLGLIVLSTDETLEAEARALLAPGCACATGWPPDLAAVGYGCTSGATVIGPERVAGLIGVAHPGVPVTDPMSAVVAALNALGAARIALVSPYVASVTGPMRAHMAENGIEVVRAVSFEQREDRIVGRIAEASTLAAILAAAAGGGIDAVFASCTNLRTLGILDEAENRLGVPVVSSNAALMWHLARIAGRAQAVRGPGRLFATRAA